MCKYLYRANIYTFIFSMIMELGEYITIKLEQKGSTKDLLMKHLGLSRGTLYNKLKKSDFSVQEFEQTCKFLKISPMDWFNVQGFIQPEIDINQVNEPMTSYLKIKKYENKMLKTPDTVDSLIQQNQKLIEIIDRLTK